MNNRIIGVIGAGQMGSGIAAVFALNGFKVQLVDAVSEAVSDAKKNIFNQLQTLLDKNSYTDVVSEIVSRISFQDRLSAIKDSELIIEAIPEDLDLKISLYRSLNSILNPATIVATNTSSFPIFELANGILNKEKFIGLHFMNPVLKMSLIEIVPSIYTSEQTVGQVQIILGRLKDKQRIISADEPGFVVNRLLIPVINQAFIVLGDKIATREDIDIAMEKGANFPMGPLKLADLIGLDTCLAIMESLDNAFPNKGYLPAPLLKDYVLQGKLGRKSKGGVYKYE
ncbi:MAG: 3-hydroxybutyryl-CoA dehydrogenase [Candidatus Paracaedibacteraceae bacterium]|nr:3-hydroxybutyryl-CoA dehydrogenase [Candidatus Paracaedibacteraceae bacterium]